MAKASRSKQPAFDPNELNDLIFSPAVGTGVSSHLLEKVERFPATSHPGITILAATTPHLSTVDTFGNLVSSHPHSSELKPLQVLAENSSKEKTAALDMATVAMSELSTVDMCNATAAAECNIDPFLDLTTVVTTHLPTVARSSPNEAEDAIDLSTVVTAELATVAISHYSPPYSKKIPLWVTEQGDLIPPGRVNRIRLAQDVINSAEESVYDTLWTSAKGAGDERETSRVVQAGYDYLAKRTRLARKTIQRIVAKLIHKDFITIERPADIYERTSTVYRVFNYKTVLDRHIQRGRTHVAKVGPGFSYVKSFNDPKLVPDLSTVVLKYRELRFVSCDAFYDGADLQYLLRLDQMFFRIRNANILEHITAWDYIALSCSYFPLSLSAPLHVAVV